MPKNIEEALNKATEARLKMESAQLSCFYDEMVAYQQKYASAYSLLKKWVRNV